jgi:hypothetical protein
MPRPVDSSLQDMAHDAVGLACDGLLESAQVLAPGSALERQGRPATHQGVSIAGHALEERPEVARPLQAIYRCAARASLVGREHLLSQARLASSWTRSQGRAGLLRLNGHSHGSRRLAGRGTRDLWTLRGTTGRER